MAYIGATPIPIRSGAPTATGTPNPVMPCRKLSKIQPIASTSNSSFGSSLLMPSLMTMNAFASSPTWYMRIAVHMINRMTKALQMPLALSTAMVVMSALYTSRPEKIVISKPTGAASVAPQ